MKPPEKIFISYAHIDNEVMGSGQLGWITSFHKALEIRLSQLMGNRPVIWRDQKLQGNDFFGDEIVDQFPEVAVLLSIISPRYLTSEWCMRELETFCKTAGATGGLRVGNKSRVFKIIKTQIPFEKHPEVVRDLLGYDFFQVDPQTGRARELSQTAGPDLERLYWTKLDDLAYDITQIMEDIPDLAQSAAPVAAVPAAAGVNGDDEDKKTIFLADASYDLREERDAIKRELQQFGHEVVPSQPPPLYIDDLNDLVREELAQADLAVHLVGRNYGIIPEGATASLVAIESELSGERDSLDRLIWMPPDLVIEDERQREFQESLYTREENQKGADILETSIEDLKAVIHEKLKPKPKPKPSSVEQEEGDEEPARIYILCDPNDLEELEPLEDYLYDNGYEVILPVFDGDEAQVREDHQENLRLCEAVIIYFGQAGELWLRSKLRELQKIAGYGRTEPLRAKAIYVGSPADRKKDRLRSREALVIKGQTGFEPSLLDEFVNQLSQGPTP